MTTIKSTHYDNHFLDLPDTDAGETWLVVRQVDATGQSDARMLGVTVKTADLLAALDATANTEIPLALDRLRDKWMDDWKARAEKAEATVERVRKWAVFNLSDAHHKALLKNIDPPAFTLPTEAGARFDARYNESCMGMAGQSTVFTTLAGMSDPRYVADDDPTIIYTADEVRRDFEDFRLIGAES